MINLFPENPIKDFMSVGL